MVVVEVRRVEVGMDVRRHRYADQECTLREIVVCRCTVQVKGGRERVVRETRTEERGCKNEGGWIETVWIREMLARR